ncbi:Spore germination protein B3 precursor [compost metagenome]
MMIDLNDNGQFELTLGFPLPNRMIPGDVGGSGQAGKNPFAYVTKTGKNLALALQDIQSDLSRDITFGQTRVLVLGQKLAQQGTDPVLDFISRHIAFHISANVFIFPGRVLELVETPTTFERFISVILRAYVDQKQTIDTTLRDVLRARYESGDVLIPMLTYGKQPAILAKMESTDKWLGVDGAAILKRGRVISPLLNKQEMGSALLVSSNIKDMTIGIKSPTDGKDITFNVQHVNTKFKTRIKNDVPYFRLHTKGTAIVLTSDSNLNLRNEEHLILLQKALDREIQSRIMQLINLTRKARSDVFHLKDYLSWKYPAVWRGMKSDWNEFYAKDLDIESVVNMKLLRTGEAYQTIKIE